jgi:hypothetical protein
MDGDPRVGAASASGGKFPGEFKNPLSLCHVCHFSSFAIELPMTDPVTHPAVEIQEGALSIRVNADRPVEVGCGVLAWELIQ